VRDAMRRTLQRLALVLACLGAVQPGAWAQAWPSKPITIVIPLAAGSPPETMARAVGQSLQVSLGQPMLFVPRGGAGGTLGGVAVAKSRPDGYTLLMGSVTSLSIGPALFPQSGFNPSKTLVPIGQVYSSPFVIVTGAKFPASTLKDFIAEVKARPGVYNFTAPTAGSQPHMAGEMFKAAAGVDLVHVPFGNIPLAVNAMLTGQAHLMIAGPGLMLGNIRSGAIKVLAAASRRRLAVLPDVPTTAEAGLPGLEVDSWGALVGPAGLPESIVRPINAAIQKAIQEREVRVVLERFGAEPQGGTPEELGRLMAEDEARWTRAVKMTGAEGKE
jgi:tripartite-type tricarboxylate transporter receptor subunit TctC